MEGVLLCGVCECVCGGGGGEPNMRGHIKDFLNFPYKFKFRYRGQHKVVND